MSDPLNRNLLLKEIVIECSPDDVGSPALNGLALTILNIEGGQLDLEKISETTWKHGVVVEIPPLTNQLSIVVWSTGAGDIGCVSFMKDDWNKIQDDSPQLDTSNYLKRDFEMGEMVLKLSLSLNVHISTSDQISGWMSARENPVASHASGLSNRDDDASKANQLNLLGDQFLKAFQITQDDKDVCKAIEAYKQAAACLAMDDPRLGPFLLDICFGYQERHDVFGSKEDLEDAITTGKMAIAVTAVEHPKFPALLSNLGGAFYRRFELIGDLDDIDEAIQNRQRAVQLTPDGHPDLPGRLSNLGFSFCDRFDCTGDLDDIFKAIQYAQRAVQLTPDGHEDLPGGLCNLGDTFSSRFEHTGNLEDISTAIQNQQRAVQLVPDRHTALPGMLNNLGSSFSCRFKRTGDLDDISKAIQNQQRAIQLTPDGCADLPIWVANLGNSIRCRFDCTGDLDDISKAIENVQHAVQLTPDGHARLPDMLTMLGMAFLSRFEHVGDLDDVFEAIQNQQRAVQLIPDGHADLPGMLGNLSNTFLCRFERTGNLDDISEAIQNLQRAVELTPDHHSHFPSMLAGLGNAFLRHFQHTGDLASLSEAIQNQRAVQLTPDGHAELPGMLNNLGTILSERFKRSGDLVDISDAVQNLQRAVQLTPDGRADLPGRLGNLGSTFWLRFERTGDMGDIAKAIQNAQLAVQLTPDGHADLPMWLSSLGNAFASRFECTGDLDDISNAIQNFQRVIQLTPEGHAELPGWLSNLGVSFCDRFERTGNLDDISEAIQNQQLAVQLTPNGHTAFPSRLNNLGIAFHRRFKRTGDLDDVFEAIQNQRRAIQLTPDGHADLVIWLTNLGVSLCDRFESTRDLDDISKAIQNQQRAIELTPEVHPDLPGRFGNLGTAFFCRFKCTGDPDDISEAIRNQQQAIQLTPEGHVDLPGRLVNLGNTFSSHFEATGRQEFRSNAVSNYRLAAISSGPPSIRLHSATRWVGMSQESPCLSSQLLDAYACIIHLLSLVSGLENTIQRRYEALVDSSQLSTAASAAALALGHPDKALEWLVEGRCVVWNQINQLRTPVDELRAHDRALSERVSAVSRELENAGSRWESRRTKTSLSMDDKISLEEQAGKHIKLAKEWDQLLASIRNITGFEDFLQPRKCIDIMRQLPDEGVIVVINIHSDRCDALALRAGASKPVHVPLPHFSYQEAERLAKRLAKGLHGRLLRHRAMAESRIGIPLADANDPPGADLPEILKVLWFNVVRPILEALAFFIHNSESESLAKLPRIWWCPTGPLAFLPIHAAGVYVQAEGTPKESLSDFAVSSYIPMVNVLLKTSKSNSVEKHGDVPSRFMIVSQPNTPGQSPIPFAADEAKRISKQLEKRQISSVTLDDQQGTVDGLLKAMESFPCIHLACHANQNMKNPLKSSIHLHDGPLDLSEIMKKNLLYSDFAFLSACQTSMGDENLPEEVVHLAAGMLAAGYRSVVGTMWSIFDRYGPDLAEFFYESFLEDATDEGSRIDGTGAAQALHNATQRLRIQLADSPESLLAWVPYIHIGN